MAIKHILVPVDFSAPSLRALDYAIDFARPLDAELIVVFVVEPIYSITPGELYAPSSELSYLMQEQRQQGKEQLAQLEARLQKRSKKLRTVLGDGLAYQAIVDAAKKLAKFDLTGTIKDHGFSQDQIEVITATQAEITAAIRSYHIAATLTSQALQTSGAQQAALVAAAHEALDTATQDRFDSPTRGEDGVRGNEHILDYALSQSLARGFGELVRGLFQTGLPPVGHGAEAAGPPASGRPVPGAGREPAPLRSP